MFFNGKMNAEIFIKAKHKAFGIRLDIHKKWLSENINTHFLDKKSLFKNIIDFTEKGYIQTESEAFQSLVTSIREEFEKTKNPLFALNLKTKSYQLIQNYFEEIVNQNNHSISTEKQYFGELKYALNFMEKSVYKDFPGNDFLAELCKISESSFSKKFKSAFKITAAQHFRNLKMKEALRLLKLGYNVKNTSYKIGYQDTSAFGRIFKQTYGRSPASYVK